MRAAKQGQQARRLEVSYELQQAYAAAQTAKQMLDLYDQAILPQAELARDSAQASYTVGNVDFLTVLTNYTAIYSYQLDYHRQRADYEIAIARIQGLTGDLDAPARTGGTLMTNAYHSHQPLSRPLSRSSRLLCSFGRAHSSPSCFLASTPHAGSIRTCLPRRTSASEAAETHSLLV